MRGISRRRAAVGIALAVLLLAGCDLPFGGSTAAPVPGDIKPEDAMKAVKDFWVTREDSYVHLNGNALDPVEAGDLNTIDRAIIDLRVRVKKPGQAAARQLNNVKVYAPHQKVYPGQFLASGETPDLDADLKPTGNPLTFFFLFTKADPDKPYKALMISIQDPGQSIPELAVDKDGFASLVPSEGQAGEYVVASSQLGQKLADTLNALKLGNQPAVNPFAPGQFSSQEGASEKELIGLLAQRHVQLKIDFTGPTTATNFAYQTKDGRALMLFIVKGSILYAANPAGCIVFAPSRAQVARGVPPAVFRALAYTVVGIGAAVVPKSSDKAALVSLPAMASGPEDVNAVPC